MKISLAVKLAEFELERFPQLSLWKITTNSKMKRILGLCDYKEKFIVLSESFVALNDVCQVRNTVLHEIAHALVGPGHGHNLVWKNQALALGIKPERCNSSSVQPKGTFVTTCPNCQKTFNLYRKPKYTKRICRKCNVVCRITS